MPDHEGIRRIQEDKVILAGWRPMDRGERNALSHIEGETKGGPEKIRRRDRGLVFIGALLLFVNLSVG